MKVNVYPIASPLHDPEFLEKATNRLFSSLHHLLGYDFALCDIDSLYEADLSLVLVQSGGSESFFLEVKDRLKDPVYLLTFGNNNSLAASLEILTYIHNNGKEGEILHGDDNYLAERIKTLIGEKNG
ncbi:MAG: hypothetical protein K5694_00120 [Bacilli bacterium]|nr:hypothetical protein [Bacilli bacterium]